jgi:hypothetical protein
MPRLRSSRLYGAEIHRYFPEWADRPVKDGLQRESDRNSYSAGGYAEEFGYAAQPGLPAPARPLNGDVECSKWWHFQIGALHPGYPECPRPLDRDSVGRAAEASSSPKSIATQRAPDSLEGAKRTVELRGGHSCYFQVVRVERSHSVLAHAAFLGQLVLGWNSFRLRRHRRLPGL